MEKTIWLAQRNVLSIIVQRSLKLHSPEVLTEEIEREGVIRFTFCNTKTYIEIWADYPPQDQRQRLGAKVIALTRRRRSFHIPTDESFSLKQPRCVTHFRGANRSTTFGPMRSAVRAPQRGPFRLPLPTCQLLLHNQRNSAAPSQN